LLDDRELRWLNEYHEAVFRALGGFLEPELKKWLRDKTRPIRQDK
jgi:hypothetical protein